MSTFAGIAQAHADLFIQASNIEAYFTVEVKILDEGLENADLASNELVYDILEFGLQKEPGDRYAGITTGDLALEGSQDVAGWTTGGQAVVSEDWDISISAHELGHTFGLCDEYNYSIWTQQNDIIRDGCPNPYPEGCPLDESLRVHCDGALTDDGAYSIMGPAGLIGERGYNTPCYSHLQKIFEALANAGVQ
jgi:hypothetical protein